jgi:hypothetical protein
VVLLISECAAPVSPLEDTRMLSVAHAGAIESHYTVAVSRRKDSETPDSQAATISGWVFHRGALE